MAFHTRSHTGHAATIARLEAELETTRTSSAHVATLYLELHEREQALALRVVQLEIKNSALEAELARRRVADTIAAQPMSDDDGYSSATSASASSPRIRR